MTEQPTHTTTTTSCSKVGFGLRKRPKKASVPASDSSHFAKARREATAEDEDECVCERLDGATLTTASLSATSKSTTKNTPSNIVIPMRQIAAEHREKPMLLRNVHNNNNDFEQSEDVKFRLDVARRPTQASAAAYERIPVAAFGRGMLAGMGWSEGKPIGLSNKQVIKPIDFVRRRHRLGLGASAQAIPPPPPTHDGRKGKRRDRRFDEKMKIAKPKADGRVRHVRELDEKLVDAQSLQVCVGSSVSIISGDHRGLNGRVTSTKKERAKVLLTVSDVTVSVSLKRLRLTNNNDKYLEKKSKKRRKVARIRWVVPNLRVRVISKTIGAGKFYRQLGHVEDVISSTEFTLIMSQGRILDHVIEDDVETVVPEASGAQMRIVAGSKRGALCVLVERRYRDGLAVVRLLDSDDIVSCSLDDVCERIQE